MYKKLIPFVLLIACTKPKLETAITAAAAETTVSSNATSSLAVNNATKFGASICDLSGPDEISVANKLGVKYLRRGLALDDVTITGLQKISAAGLGVVLNVNYTSAKPDPPVKRIADYKKKLGAFLDSYKPDIIVIRNEELNLNYNVGTVQDYIAELKAAIEVAHTKGVKVTNGGIGSTPLILLTYHDYLARGMITEANDFAKRMIPAEIVKRSFDNKDMAAKLQMGRDFLAAYKNTDLDYVNFHWYMPARISDNYSDTIVDKKAISEVVDYLRRATGKKIMSNETGQLNNSPKVVIQTAKAYNDAKVSYLLWYSGDGGPYSAVALHNRNTTLRPNGDAYAHIIQKLSF